MTIKSQKKQFKKETKINGELALVVLKMRHDDNCGNGHNTFTMTVDVYEKHRQPGETMVKLSDGKFAWLSCCGCKHDMVAEVFPEFAHMIKWHLVSTDGPMHYLANSLYFASDKDYNGLRKGEKRQIRNGRTGLLSWKLETEDGRSCKIEGIETYVDSNEQPESPIPGIVYAPWYKFGEGKEPDLKGARNCAVWPDAQLQDFTKENLEARLPELLESFRRGVEALGFTF